jgi:hypothetical protein
MHITNMEWEIIGFLGQLSQPCQSHDFSSVFDENIYLVLIKLLIFMVVSILSQKMLIKPREGKIIRVKFLDLVQFQHK